MKSSPFLTLSYKDLAKGFFISVLSALLSGLYSLINKGSFSFDLATFKPILLVSLGSGISYLLKNLFTNSQDQLMKKEPNTEAVK